MNITYYNGWVDFDEGILFIKLSKILRVRVIKNVKTFSFCVYYNRNDWTGWTFDTREKAKVELDNFKKAAGLIDTRTAAEIAEDQELECQMTDAVDGAIKASERLNRAASMPIGQKKPEIGDGSGN